ncbi:MAG: hypothetical protein LBG97_00635 [Coriobacteriales bacterium]|nr:hypothetical protein [Coriobacteriales bacterium]
MLDYNELFCIEPYSLEVSAKEALLAQWLKKLGEHHEKNCGPYARLVKALGADPALPVRLFKSHELRSIPKEDVVKTMTSSGTTGQAVSRIYLDKATSARQSKALAQIVSAFTGKSRLPLLVIDSSAVIKNRAMFSARGAGILGFSFLGRDVTYALDDDMQLNLQAVKEFCERHSDNAIMLFGFTYMIWLYFIQALRERNEQLNINGVLIHGGGWKKLQDQQVSNDSFKQIVHETTGITRIHNYYGMVEQTGSIYMECECGHLHVSELSDIQIVNPLTLEINNNVEKSSLAGNRGLIRCTSLLPTSYPGHILLTEDVGEILGVDDCPCGRKGKYFAVYGRLEGAEVRGCSDTHERR